MQGIEPAKRLRDVRRAVELQPLASGDSRYVDISGGRSTIDLGMMRSSLEDFDAQRDQFAKITFTGHRGCGKSTELLRLENDLAGQFTALHFFATEDEIIGDYDYAELFLDLVEALVRKFKEDEVSLNARLAEDISTWFAEVTLGEVEKIKKKIELSTDAELKVKYGVFWLSGGLLTKLRSTIAGSNEAASRDPTQAPARPTRADPPVQPAAGQRPHVRSRRPQAGEPADRRGQPRSAGDQGGPDLILRRRRPAEDARAHLIYTVPIATALAPRNIGTIFERGFTLPMVKVRTEDGKPFDDGINALLEVVKSEST